jgi:hypothetical protein
LAKLQPVRPILSSKLQARSFLRGKLLGLSSNLEQVPQFSIFGLYNENGHNKNIFYAFLRTLPALAIDMWNREKM